MIGLSFVSVLDGLRANGLGMSRAAPIDREGTRADSSFQNADDLGAAQRRRLHARVGPQASYSFTQMNYTAFQVAIFIAHLSIL